MPRKTKHGEIVTVLTDEIANGKYPPLGVFPSERALMTRFGVSRCTVRLAMGELRNLGLVYGKRSTCARVAKNGAQDKAKIGVLISGNRHGEIFPKIEREIRRLAAEESYETVTNDASILDCGCTGKRSVKSARHLVSAGVKGVILRPVELSPGDARANAEMLRLFAEASVPVVLLDCDAARSPEWSGQPLVALDNFSAGRLLASHLKERGVQKVAFVARRNYADSVKLRLSGVRSVFGEGIVNLLLVKDYSGVPELKKALRGVTELEAVICQNDVAAETVSKALEAMGLLIPRQVMLAGFDDVAVAKEMRPQLTTVRQPCDEIAKAAFDCLVRRMQEPASPVTTVLLRGQLMVRGSTDAVFL